MSMTKLSKEVDEMSEALRENEHFRKNWNIRNNMSDSESLEIQKNLICDLVPPCQKIYDHEPESDLLVFVMIEEITVVVVLAAEIIGSPPKIIEASELGNK